ncbi:MAG TPA: ACT domain-containing protein [Thermoanaerobacterales bacterium]|nr:ACT domain-containing protein [Thermoanaerobacterales bacterium]
MELNYEYYIVKSDILPDILKKTVKAKELLNRGIVNTVNDAAEEAGMSRSAYYKYKDYIFPFYEVSKNKIITISLVLEDKPGILSSILDHIAKAGGNILTINQNIPLSGIANVTISIRTEGMDESVERLVKNMGKIDGVKKIGILAQG